MRTEFCETLGIEFPIFAFSHCRDVVAEVSRAGGLGVLGAVGFSPDQLETELAWLDEHVGDRPYGVDIVIPSKYEGMDLDDMTPDELEAEMARHVPDGHRAFGAKLLADHGVPELPEGDKHQELLGWTSVTAGPQIDVILDHPAARLVANALGTPPPDVVARIQGSGRLVGALCGSVRHALRQIPAAILPIDIRLARRLPAPLPVMREAA